MKGLQKAKISCAVPCNLRDLPRKWSKNQGFLSVHMNSKLFPQENFNKYITDKYQITCETEFSVLFVCMSVNNGFKKKLSTSNIRILVYG